MLQDINSVREKRNLAWVTEDVKDKTTTNVKDKATTNVKAFTFELNDLFERLQPLAELLRKLNANTAQQKNVETIIAAMIESLKVELCSGFESLMYVAFN